MEKIAKSLAWTGPPTTIMKIVRLIFILPLLFPSTTARAQVLEADSLALVALYNRTDGSNWKQTWDLTKPVATWYGVTLNQGRVTKIELENIQLTGSIPKDLGSLTNIQELRLSQNHLIGPIPTEFGNLKNLKLLDLRYNDLTSSIPSELGNLKKLNSLLLTDNELTGPIPTELGNLKNLVQLELIRNQLAGPIPAELSNLTNLRYLDLRYNQLTGSIPTGLGNLEKLNSLWLGHNLLTGSVPTELGKLTNLRSLDLEHNRFSGLPDLSQIGHLQLLRLGHNNLTFGDLEPNMNLASNVTTRVWNDQAEFYEEFQTQTFTYSPQDSIGMASKRSLSYGGSTTLSADADGTANIYQWTKNGTNIPEETGSTLEIILATLATEGRYSCTITSSRVPELRLHTRPTLIVVQPPTIAILDFVGMGISNSEALTLSIRFGTQLVKLGRYKVIERNQVKRIIQEQDFQLTGCVASDCAVEIGQLIGAQQMIAGSVGKVGTVYTIDLKIIDVETGEVIRTTSFDSVGSIDKLLTEGIKELARQIVRLD